MISINNRKSQTVIFKNIISQLLNLINIILTTENIFPKSIFPSKIVFEYFDI
jgi:hypothetical protein